jgi:AraC family transcriptional regulator
MNRVVPLVRTGAVDLRRFDHEPGVAHHDPERERATECRVAFVEAGSFRVRTSGAWREVTTNWVLVTSPSLEFSCAHDEEYPRDRCLSVAYSDEAVESARSAVALSPAPLHPLTNRHAFLRHMLQRCTPGDEARVEALAGALLGALAAPTPRTPLYRPDRLAWYARRVERAKDMIDAYYAEPLSLSTLAHDAGMSLFHFARIFSELEGRPPHRVLTDVRLAQAAARLRDGAGVTDTCFAVGFGSLSHFVTTFRQRYGVRPSELRRPETAVRASVRRGLLLSERGQRLDARGAARGQVGRERGDGAQQHDDDRVRRDVVRRDAEEQRAERPQEQQRAGDANGGAEGDEREAAGDD